MITTRARGLANLHVGASTLLVGIFFWVYAELIMAYVPVVKLSPTVNLIPYFLCVVGGMLLSARDLSRLVARFHVLDLGGAVQLAARQVGLMAILTFTMMWATVDHYMSRLFLGTFLVFSWVGLAVLNAKLPRALARVVFQRGHRLPTVFIGRRTSFARLNEWIAHKEPLGIDPVALLSDDPPPEGGTPLPAPWLGKISDLPRILTEKQVGQVLLLELPASDEEARHLIDICQHHGCRLLIPFQHSGIRSLEFT